MTYPNHKTIRVALMIGLLIGGSQVGLGQKVKERVAAAPAVTASYFGQMAFRPGLRLGVEQSLRTTSLTRTKKNGKVKTKFRSYPWLTQVGFYHHAQNHTSLFLTTETGYRKQNNKGYRYEFLAGIGYQRTFNSGRTYRVTETGEVERVGLAGQNHFMPTFTFGYGRDLSQRRNIPLSWHMRHSIFLQMPYNTTVNQLYNLEVGISYRIPSLFKSTRK